MAAFFCGDWQLLPIPHPLVALVLAGRRSAAVPGRFEPCAQHGQDDRHNLHRGEEKRSFGLVDCELHEIIRL